MLLAVCIVASCKKTALISPESIAAQLKIDTGIILQYIKDNGLEGKAKRVADTIGVYYVVEDPGTGSSIYSNATTVTVSDTAKLLTTQKVFSFTNDFHPSYVLGSVIRGWQVGIPFIQPGGRIRLLVPSHYAYGPFPQSDLGLPANAVLDFDITLYAVTN